MVDKIQLPGTEMEVFEKYPLSRRLDHPTFGDVNKTPYALGVITEFQQTADDPITVTSMVKVDIGGDAWLPLFYHPKALYWDGDDVLATDFDEETGAFKQAWQSFRAGDEVAVMFKEGVPVAVLGFTEGKPKVGENLIKIVTTSPSNVKGYKFVSCAKGTDGNVANIYSSGEDDPDGPDGKKLGITEEIIATITEDAPVVHDVWYLAGGTMEVGYNSPTGDDWDNYAYFYKRRTTRTDYHVEFVMPVGPIKYIIKFIISHIIVVNGPLVEEYYWHNNEGTFPSHSPYDAVGYQDPAGGLSLNGTFASGSEINKTHTHPGNATMWVDSGSLTVGVNFSLDGDSYGVTPDSTEKVKACQYQQDDSDAVIQNDFYDNFHWYFVGLVKDQNTIQVFVRPHNG